MDNSLPRVVLLLTSREIMSWLITATIAFRFSTLRASLSGSLGLKERKRSSDYQGNFVRIVGAGQIDKSNHLFVDSEDNILVADYNNKCIQVFHQNGNHIKTIGTGQIFPLGVCMDREGRIIVSEAANRISIF